MSAPTQIGITVNGEDHLLTEEMSVRELLAYLKLPDKGIAIAIGGGVFPRSRWDEPVQKGWELDILTAVQGG
jgi:sulfur carrier protein